MSGVHRPAAPATALLLLLLGAAPAQAHPESALAIEPGVTPDTVTATIRYVHTEQPGIDIIVGVQYALRLEYVLVTDSTRIVSDGREIALRQLEPGALVHVDFRETERGKVARTIRVIARAEEGGGA